MSALVLALGCGAFSFLAHVVVFFVEMVRRNERRLRAQVRAVRKDNRCLRDAVAACERALAEARETNRDLNRRVQGIESGALKEEAMREAWSVKNANAHLRADAASLRDRLSRAHESVREIFETVAPVLSLPYGRYQSIMDRPFKDPVYRFREGPVEPGLLYANVIVTSPSHTASYEINGCVKQAVTRLQDALEKAEARSRTAEARVAELEAVIAGRDF